MKIGIMQPYFFPYIGYFQLINAVDKFVVYDNIEFTKKGWIHRNRILVNGKDDYISLMIKKDSDYLDVRERYLSPEYDRVKLLRRIEGAYRKAPFFDVAFPLIKSIINNQENNLFKYIYHSIIKISEILEINTEILISSEINIDHSLKGKDKVIQVCKALQGNEYINPIGGIELYDKNEFGLNSLNLKFIKADPLEYIQFKNSFVPWLSIIDVLMFNGIEKTQSFLNRYELT